MPGRPKPFPHLVLERLDVHAGMRRADDLQQRLLAPTEHLTDVAVRSGLKHPRRRPVRIGRRQRLRPVHREQDLEIERPLRPERPVVVEHRDPRVGRHIAVGGRIGHAVHEVDDRGPRIRVVPGRQRIGGCGAGGAQRKRGGKNVSDHLRTSSKKRRGAPRTERPDFMPGSTGAGRALLDH